MDWTKTIKEVSTAWIGYGPRVARVIAQGDKVSFEAVLQKMPTEVNKEATYVKKNNCI